MTSEHRSKLNRVLTQWPQGAVAVSRWLEARDAYQQLIHEYEKSGWIRRIGQGAYARAGDRVEWTGGLHALQEQLHLPIHAGAKTALQMQGYAHYLPMGKVSVISLFGNPGTRLPAWFRKYDWGVEVDFVATKLFAGNSDAGLSKNELAAYAITVSAPERAIMEVLYLVPGRESFDEASQIMEGLTTLRPHLVQLLLERCNSVKVKRLFMFLAEHHNHAWAGKLDTSKVDFGKGKRMLVKGGSLDTKYNITVPEAYLQREASAESA